MLLFTMFNRRSMKLSITLKQKYKNYQYEIAKTNLHIFFLQKYYSKHERITQTKRVILLTSYSNQTF